MLVWLWIKPWFVKPVFDNEVKAKEAYVNKGKTDVKPKSMTSRRNKLQISLFLRVTIVGSSVT
jgi:hypothetical protein